jgi:hypothetical protein
MSFGSIDRLVAMCGPPHTIIHSGKPYLDVRAELYRGWEDQIATRERAAESAKLQTSIWTKAVAASQGPSAPAQATMLVLPAINAFIDVTAARSMAALNHPPLVVFVLLGGLAVVGATLVGYGTATSKHRTWLHTVGYAAILSLTVYVIVDLEYPRLGLIRVDAADQVLFDLRQSMR